MPFLMGGGNFTVKFLALSDWEATCSENFLTVSDSSGTASTDTTYLHVKVAANETPYPRDAKLRLAFVTNVVTINVSQEANPNWPFDPGHPDKPDKPDNPDNPDNPGTDGSLTEDVVPGDDID